MFEHILAWTGFVVILLLCLPFRGSRRLVLEVYGWGLRLALLALLVAGATLWFRPDLLPPAVGTFLDGFPALRDLLPPAGSQTFGLAAAALAAAVLLPLVAVLDVARRVSGSRVQVLRGEATSPSQAPPAAEPVAAAPPTHRRPDRRAAAETMGEIGSRKPFRIADGTP